MSPGKEESVYEGNREGNEGMAPGGSRLRAGKYLVFLVGKERYAIPLSQVREVIALTNMTRLPALNASLEGVFNLRGKILSVADLRNKLAAGVAGSKRPCIVAVDIDGYEVANIVDEVLEVAAFSDKQLTSSLGDYSFRGVFKEHILGVAKVPTATADGNTQELLTIVLDIRKLLALDRPAEAEAAGPPGAAAA